DTKSAAPNLEELRQGSNPSDATNIDPESSVGDLETPWELLEFLVSPEALQNEMDFILEDTPLASMFDFALPKMKPPPPPPTPPLPPPQKVKRDRKGKKKKAADAPDKSTSALLKPRRR
ncbi:hypothetical protein H0H87_001562, partial [Tephrocybe sp. NHM501043]